MFRVNGLIKSGAMKIEDRPIWYDVYKAFPPESEPTYAMPAKPYKVPHIFFPEDVFRALVLYYLSVTKICKNALINVFVTFVFQ